MPGGCPQTGYVMRLGCVCRTVVREAAFRYPLALRGGSVEIQILAWGFLGETGFCGRVSVSYFDLFSQHDIWFVSYDFFLLLFP